MSVMVWNKEQFVLILLLFSKDLYPDLTALHVTLVSWRYCIARDTYIMTLLHCKWHLYHDVTLVSWRYCIARDTCIMTLLHCTWHLYQDVTALHVTLVSWRYCIAHDTCIMTLLHCTWHFCLRDNEALRLLNYFTFLSFMCTPSASWLRSMRINNYIYKKKLRGLSPRANYTDRAAAAGRRS